MSPASSKARLSKARSGQMPYPSRMTPHRSPYMTIISMGIFLIRSAWRSQYLGYYGWYSNVSRGKPKMKNTLDINLYIIESDRVYPAGRKS